MFCIFCYITHLIFSFKNNNGMTEILRLATLNSNCRHIGAHTYTLVSSDTLVLTFLFEFLFKTYNPALSYVKQRIDLIRQWKGIRGYVRNEN